METSLNGVMETSVKEVMETSLKGVMETSMEGGSHTVEHHENLTQRGIIGIYVEESVEK